MHSLSYMMLSGGAGVLIPALHGEAVTVLTGLDAGKTYNAVIEIEHDLTLAGDGIGMDRRAKRVVRFTNGNVPKLTGNDQIKDGAGKKWILVDDPQDGFITTDYEMQAVLPGKDQT